MHFHSLLPALALSVPFVSARAAAGHKRTTGCGSASYPTKQNTIATDQNTATSPNGTTASNTTEVDVIIVGGGATGAWTAVQLRDQGKTVAVVERASQLGGHVDTLFAAGSNAPIDYGVQAYIDNNQTRQFFERFGLNLTAAAQSTLPSVVADFSNGIVTNASAPDLTQLVEPLTAYILAALQFDFLNEGAYDIPAEVPADLLLPFGEFVAKNNLSAALPVVWQFAQGVGNLLEATTLYVLQNFGVPHLLGLQQGYLYAAEGNQAVYDRAAAFLADSVRYNSRVQSTTRNADGTTTVVVASSSSSSSSTTIRAKKVLITIPPTLDNLAGFDLSADEQALFAQWQDVPYYVGVTANTGLPDLTNFINANVTSPSGLPTTPLVWRLESVGVPGYQTVKVIGEPDSAAAQALVTAAVGRLGRALNATVGAESTTTFAAWEQHDNLQLHVSPEAVREGFYQKLYALQGVNGTYWTGNAFCSDYSPLLWQFTEKRVLPGLLA